MHENLVRIKAVANCLKNRNFDEQIHNGPEPVRQYLAAELGSILDSPDFEEGLYAHMESVRYGADVGRLIAKIKYSLSLPNDIK